MNKLKLALSALALIAYSAQSDAQQYKYETPMPPGVASPDKVETSIGTLNLSYGYPDAATVQKVYDNLDASRALQAYLLALPMVNQASMRDTLRKFGPVNQTDVIWDEAHVPARQRNELGCFGRLPLRESTGGLLDRS